jgi:hypothetical protein
MDKSTYIKAIEGQIAEHQRVQMSNPPTSQPWKDASAEINRLAMLILKAQGKAVSNDTLCPQCGKAECNCQSNWANSINEAITEPEQTTADLLFQCLKDGIQGEKVDVDGLYQDGDTLAISFEDNTAAIVTVQEIRACQTVIYNDGRPNHTNVRGLVLAIHAEGFTAQFEDRAEPNLIRFTDADWMKHLRFE